MALLKSGAYSPAGLGHSVPDVKEALAANGHAHAAHSAADACGPLEGLVSRHPHYYGTATAAEGVPAQAATVYGQLQVQNVPVSVINYARSKRALDFGLALFGLIVGLPLFAAIAVVIRLTSRGPILFRQTRVGTGGNLFVCYKFRSMCVEAEAQRSKLLHMNEASGPVFKMKKDPRVTPCGRILRKFSLDELPQLWNVLRGDMSIVGPRPPIPAEVEDYSARQLGRLCVRPGLTCLWQISGRSDVAFDHWVELDLLYIETMSFWGDVRIILKTVPAVVSARGAH